MPYVRTEIYAVIIALKALYRAMGDEESFSSVDALLKQYAPTFYDEEARKQHHADLEAKYSTTEEDR